METLADPRYEARVAAYFESISSGDVEAWISLFDADAVVHEPVDSPPAEGREAIREAWKALSAPFEKLAIEVDTVVFSSSGAAAKWTGRATGVDGSKTAFEGITIFEFAEDAAIEAVVSYWDPAAVLIALAGENTPAVN